MTRLTARLVNNISPAAAIFGGSGLRAVKLKLDRVESFRVVEGGNMQFCKLAAAGIPATNRFPSLVIFLVKNCMLESQRYASVAAARATHPHSGNIELELVENSHDRTEPFPSPKSVLHGRDSRSEHNGNVRRRSICSSL